MESQSQVERWRHRDVGAHTDLCGQTSAPQRDGDTWPFADQFNSGHTPRWLETGTGTGGGEPACGLRAKEFSFCEQVVVPFRAPPSLVGLGGGARAAISKELCCVTEFNSVHQRAAALERAHTHAPLGSLARVRPQTSKQFNDSRSRLALEFAE